MHVSHQLSLQQYTFFPAYTFFAAGLDPILLVVLQQVMPSRFVTLMSLRRTTGQATAAAPFHAPWRRPQAADVVAGSALRAMASKTPKQSFQAGCSRRCQGWSSCKGCSAGEPGLQPGRRGGALAQQPQQHGIIMYAGFTAVTRTVDRPFDCVWI
jgi:hypothetical protein